MIVGYHEPTRHRYLKTNLHDSSPAAIVMGIGGKPKELLNVDLVKQDQVLVLKRFSGGGTVVLDYDSIWTTVIGRPDEFMSEHYPRPIMEWTANKIFGPLFARLGTSDALLEKKTLVLDTKSCAVENTGRMITLPTGDVSIATPDFALRENDYVLGERKIGGNAQSITKSGFLHHTSFLWDFDHVNMDYLTLPEKRPDYRGDRSHDDFLVKLNSVYPARTKSDFVTALKEACEEEFQLEIAILRDVIKIVEQQGGMNEWFHKKSRTKIVTDF